MSVSGWLKADAPLCAERRAPFIHAWTDQLILTLGLWTGGGGRRSGEERCRSRQVMRMFRQVYLFTYVSGLWL